MKNELTMVRMDKFTIRATTAMICFILSFIYMEEIKERHRIEILKMKQEIHYLNEMIDN